MRRARYGRSGFGVLLALIAFALVLLLSPAQHDDFGPSSNPAHCHACMASPLASLGPDGACDLPQRLAASGAAVPPSERAQELLPVRRASGRAPPETL